MTKFHEMGLPEALIHTLEHMQFNEPTPIQAEAIPLALQGQDILASAQTGTGKTGAFGIPLVTKILSNSRGSALVMTPTRELASQVIGQLQTMLGKHSKIKSALLIGGESMPKQLTQLRNRPRIIVGTPGRINDHLQRGSLKLHDADFLVLDETDRMLDMGFTIQIERVMKHMPTKRQTLLFSATLPKDIVRIAEKYLKDPVHVELSPTSAPPTRIKQEIVKISAGEKYGALLEQLEGHDGSVIIFVKTKHSTEKLAKKLCQDGQDADAINGDLRQNKRDKVIANFRKQKYRILVATDIAARGLDIPHIEYVINYDLPQCPEDYVHRIGRTARAGAEGTAINFITSADKGKWNAIHRLLHPSGKDDEQSSPNRNRRARGNSKPSSFSKGRSKPSTFDKDKQGDGSFRKDRSDGGSFRKDRSDGSSFRKDKSEGGSFRKDRSDGGSFRKDRSDGSSFRKDRSEGGSFSKDKSEGGSFRKDRSDGGSFRKDRSEGGSFSKDKSEGGSFRKDKSEGGSFRKDKSEGGSFRKDKSEGGSFRKDKSEGGSFKKGRSKSAPFKGRKSGDKAFSAKRKP